MAITQSPLTSGNDLTNGTSYVTASISPGANKLILLAIENGDNSTAIAPSGVTGNGLTWVKIVDFVDYGSGGYETISLWRTMGASPSSGAVTITCPTTQDWCQWSIAEFDGVDTSGTNGSGAIVQSTSAGNTSNSVMTLTLAAFGDAGNGTYGAFACAQFDQLSTATPGSGFAEIHDSGVSAYYYCSLASEWRNDNDTSVDVTWSETQSFLGGVAVEIKAAAAGRTTKNTRSWNLGVNVGMGHRMPV